MTKPMKLDLYDSTGMILARFDLEGDTGVFTKGVLTYVMHDGRCAKLGLWNATTAERYVPAAGSGLDGYWTKNMFSPTLPVQLGLHALEFINVQFGTPSPSKPVAVSGTVSRSGGCLCGAWISGGIHDSHCAPHLAGKNTSPEPYDMTLDWV